MQIPPEDVTTVIIHGVNIFLNGALLVVLIKFSGPFLKEYKTWSRVKERLNKLWRKHCTAIGEDYDAVENGTK
jgi:hypothetical protein